jgi:hypothetical protein
MLPHERSLVNQMEGRPFVLLGINCDDADVVQQVAFREGLPWRNWSNAFCAGQLTSRYAVRSFPTTFVLDANGVIRYRDLRSPDLETAVEGLVRELEDRQGNP